MSRSSIFSSDTLQLRGFKPVAAGVTLLLLLVVELFIARSDYVWSCAPNSAPGIIDAMEEQVIRPAEDPQVVVLGNSRVRDAVIPASMANELGVRQDQVLNISMTGGKLFDLLTIYRRNRSELSQAKVIVIGIDDFTQIKGQPPTERFRRFASLSERCQHYGGEERMALVAGYFVRSIDAYRAMGRLAKQVLLRPNRRVVIGDDGRVMWRDEGAESADDAQWQAQRFYDKDPIVFDSWPLAELLDLCHEDGRPVLIYRPPVTEEFRQFRSEYSPGIEERYTEHMQPFLKHPAVAGVLIDDSSGRLGLGPEDYFDYGHLRAEAAEVTTKDLAAKVRPLRLVAK